MHTIRSLNINRCMITDFIYIIKCLNEHLNYFLENRMMRNEMHIKKNKRFIFELRYQQFVLVKYFSLH